MALRGQPWIEASLQYKEEGTSFSHVTLLEARLKSYLDSSHGVPKRCYCLQSEDEREMCAGTFSSGCTDGEIGRKAIIRTQAAMSRTLSDANSLDSKDDASTDGKPKSNSHDDCITPDKLPALAAGITIYDKKWTDGSVPLDTVSPALAKLIVVCNVLRLSSMFKFCYV